MLILADDLTGACDAAAAFVAPGRTAVVALADGAADDHAAVTAIDLAIREATDDEAERSVRRALERRTPASGLFLKIDSTLRGPYAAAIRAALAVDAQALAFVAPAFPAQGRTFRDGRLWLRGAAAADIRLGVATREIALERLRGERAALEREIDEAARSGTRAFAFDAETDADLDEVATLLAERRHAFAAGSAGLAHALARATPALPHGVAGTLAPGPILFVVGSASDVARAQFDLLAAHGVPAWRLDPHAPATSAEPLAGALAERGVAAIGIRAPQAASALEERAAEALASLATAAAPPGTRFVVTGGTTLRALCRLRGTSRLTLHGELGSGIVLASDPSDGSVYVTKAGAFGDATTLRAILDALRERTRP